jgi:hypothetical protein
MVNVKKISAIVAISIASLILLFIFVLYNFPYESFVKRLDVYLTNGYGTNFTVDTVKFRVPFKLVLSDIRLSKEDGSFTFSLDSVVLRFRLFNVRKRRSVQIFGNGTVARSEALEFTKARITVVSGLSYSRLMKGLIEDAIDYVSIVVEGTEVNKLLVAGFEFSSFKIPRVDILLRKQDDFFVFERGNISSNMFVSELSGKLNLTTVDGSIVLNLQNEFFQRNMHLKGIVDSVAQDGTLNLLVKGSLSKPSIKLSR